MKRNILLSLLVIASLSLATASSGRDYSEPYTGRETDHIAYPIGGFGSGMFCFEGCGAISNLSLFHHPDVFNEPATFATICVKGIEGGTRVLESQVPEYKLFERRDASLGLSGSVYGLRRFPEGVFTAEFPFAKLSLKDSKLPLTADITVWNPFIPSDEDNSSLPVAGFEYTFKNSSDKEIEAVFSFNTKNFMKVGGGNTSSIREMKNGFVLSAQNGECALFTDDANTVTDCCWFRGGWFDGVTMAWNKACSGELSSNKPQPDSPGASLYVPMKIAPGESHTVRLYMTWYVPTSTLKKGPDATQPEDFGNCYSPDLYKDAPKYYEPWYSRRFKSAEDVAAYWKENYDSLKHRTEKFTDALYSSTLPKEVIEAVGANLTILKSTTTMRQHDGRPWMWEGTADQKGSCHGTCQHVWNYAQAIAHLFPRFERSLRETEFYVDQAIGGHQAFRANLPISPIHHDFHAAADGQLGGIIKVYRDWRISGDTQWIKDMYPQIKESMDYCIRTWDPRHTGALEEPHHNTYDIEFWGADGMCTSFYAAALNCFIEMSKASGLKSKDLKPYQELLSKSRNYMENDLWNGEYFYQKVQWQGLNAPDPCTAMSFGGSYSPEAKAILLKEGPKYQYGTGCLSDGIIGCWMSLAAGIDEPVDKDKVRKHLESVYKYNLKKDLMNHSNPQRPGFALGRDGGLLLCSWPNGGKPNLPFVYSDEVWTGIEYQVAAHLIFEGDVEQGLDIVRTVRDRYNNGIRNPFNEYECGAWYARALASYSLIQALTGVRYDAVEKTLYIDSKIGDFTTFFAFDGGFATVSLKDGKPSVNCIEGTMSIDRCVVSGKKTNL